MQKIKLGKREIYALVDDEDYEYLMQWNWYLSHDGYAYRSVYSPELKRSIHNVRMHRQLLQPGEGMEVDHINHDRLDNRRANIRVCTRPQNLANKRVRSSSISKIKGVSFHQGFWRARIQTRFLGNFTTKEEAAAAYDREAHKTFGEFAVTNNLISTK